MTKFSNVRKIKILKVVTSYSYYDITVISLFFGLSFTVCPHLLILAIVNQTEQKTGRRVKYFYAREVVVAQLVDRLLSIPEVCGTNPVIGKNLLVH